MTETTNQIAYSETLNKIKTHLGSLLKDFKNSMVDPSTLEDLRQTLKVFRKTKLQMKEIMDIFTNEHLQILRKLILEERAVRQIALKILRHNLEIYPPFTQRLVNKMFPIAICKIFEDYKHGQFDERFECFKLIHSWLKASPKNFPIIFCQGIASMAKNDDYFKKGCIEFLRNLAIRKPDFCSTVGGFRILINSLIDENFVDISDNIFFTLLYVINTPSKRKFFNGFADFYKIFSIFTKSDFTIKDKDKQEETQGDERGKLDIQLELSKRIIEKLLKTWPGYSLIMGDFMAMGSIIESLNTDTSLAIKKNVLNMVKEIIESEYIVIDNFTTLSSPEKDEFYINKIYLAYLLQGLQNNKLYESLIKFIEKENNPLSEDAHKIALKFTILYSKLSNADLQLPFLNEKIEKQKQNERMLLENQIIQTKELDEEVINMKVKIMQLLDQTFYHFNCKDYTNMDIGELSSEIILAMNSVVNMQNIKKYNNQYSIESSKKELYSIDDDSFQQIVKNSKILDNKEFKNWDWKHIDEILDVIENKKDLIMELYKQKFFKRLLYCFMPSKNQFVKLPWQVDQFVYASIGTKFFRLLAQSSEGIPILDTSPEEYLFQKTLTWYEDVAQCLENLISGNIDKDQPFTIRRVYKTMSRQIFTFLGVLSQSAQGEDYLEKKGFYKLISKFAQSNYTYDYILTNLIDNLNFNSKNVIEFVQKLLEKGSRKIKRYVFEHVLCLLKFGKDVMWNIKDLINSLGTDGEINKVIINILTSLILERRYMEEFSDKSLNAVQKISAINKEIIYLLMRDRDTYNDLEDFINDEIKNIDMKKIVEDYSNSLEENMNEIFNYEDSRQDNYYLNITLPKIENQYDNYTELFWLKQLPFYVSVSNSNTSPGIILNTYLEYSNSQKIAMYAKPQDSSKIIINPAENIIKFVLMVGEEKIDTKCKSSNYCNYLTFERSEFENMKSLEINGEKYYKLVKDSVEINLVKATKDDKLNRNEYKIHSVNFGVKVRPERKQALKTPINLLTELANNEVGMQRLIDLKAIEFLFTYLDNPKAIVKEVKSALWILAKICSKETYGILLQEKYHIIQRILQYNSSCEDYAMKGTICYVICYIAQNKCLKSYLEDSYDFFFNTDICFPKNMSELYMNNKTTYESRKLKEDGEKINKLVVLNDKSKEIYSNVTSLINSISYKSAYERVNEMLKTEPKSFNDPYLLVKVYALLSKYKCRQQLRRLLMVLFDTAINSQDIVDTAVKTMDSISKELFESNENYD